MRKILEINIVAARYVNIIISTFFCCALLLFENIAPDVK
jgi:hypothetical protein